jgi:pyruvate kinase
MRRFGYKFLMIELWYTDGPASRGREQELFRNGATGARLTFSYGTPDYQLQRAQEIRNAAAQVDRPCRIMADLAGEKFRLGVFKDEIGVTVAAGARVRLIHAQIASPATDLVFPIRDASFFAQVCEGSLVTVGDGSATFRITEISDLHATADITAPGVINQSRGLTIQGSSFTPCSITTKDLSDLKHIATAGEYDVVALSFVSAASDLAFVRRLLRGSQRQAAVLAKVETSAGIDNIDCICEAADLVMAARGDLALNLPWVELPDAVRKLARAASSHSAPWILATQIFEGLERFAIPTRAEVCDLARWLEEGCAGLLLSYETAFGARPDLAVLYASTMIKRWANIR